MPFAPWSTSTSVAAQTSSLSPLGMEGTGSATSDNPGTIYLSGSAFMIVFSIDEAAGYSLTGSIDLPEGDPEGDGIALANLWWYPNGSEELVADYSLRRGSKVFDIAGYLSAGTYEMMVIGASDGPTASWSFELQLAPLPEPSTLALLLLGVGCASVRTILSRR